MSGSTEQLAFPILAFESDGAGQANWRVWDAENGGWNDIALGSGITGDQWVEMSIEFTGSSFVHRINGEVIYTDTTVNGTTEFKEVILQVQNFGETYDDVYFDNLSLIVVPTPPALAIGLAGLVGVSSMGRRRRTA